MRYSESSSFIRSLKHLPPQRKQHAKESIYRLVQFFETGELPGGLGLKQLHHNLWEIRAGLLDRIIFRRRSDCIQFIIVGTHDEIKRYLKNI